MKETIMKILQLIFPHVIHEVSFFFCNVKYVNENHYEA